MEHCTASRVDFYVTADVVQRSMPIAHQSTFSSPFPLYALSSRTQIFQHFNLHLAICPDKALPSPAALLFAALSPRRPQYPLHSNCVRRRIRWVIGNGVPYQISWDVGTASCVLFNTALASSGVSRLVRGIEARLRTSWYAVDIDEWV